MLKYQTAITEERIQGRKKKPLIFGMENVGLKCREKYMS